MALIFNNTQINQIKFINKQGVETNLTQLNFNSTPVWYALQSCTISGVALVGEIWIATVVPSEVQDLCSFQWYRGDTAISGATNSSYTTVTADRGYSIKCIASIGSASAISNQSGIIKQAVTSITISGVAEEGNTLSTTVTPSGATGTYQWYRGSTAISGATNSSYTLVNADRGNTVKCKFTGSGNYAGSVTSSASETIKGWVNVVNTIHINTTTGEKTYNFTNPIRNPKISCTIKGKYTASGGSGSSSLQIGYGGNYTKYNGWWYESGSSNSATFSDTYQVTDNVKRSSLTLSPFASAWGDYSSYSASVTSSDIWVTEYEELS